MRCLDSSGADAYLNGGNALKLARPTPQSASLEAEHDLALNT